MIGGFFDILASMFTTIADPLLTKGAPVTLDEAEKIVLKVCKDSGLHPFHAALVFAQGMHESAEYKSNVFMKNNNGFGMKYSKNQFVMGKGTPAPGGEAKTKAEKRINFYAKYDSLANSVRDLLRRQKKFGIIWEKINTANDYIDFCKGSGYFQGNIGEYKRNVASFLKKNNISTTLQG